MRALRIFGLSAALALVGVGSASAELLQPAQPPSGASLQFYIKVRNGDLAEYCKAEGLGVPACVPGKMYEAKDACPAPYKVAAVSCGLSDLGAEPKLVVAGPGALQATGSCVWSFDKLAADKAPQATTTLLCIK